MTQEDKQLLLKDLYAKLPYMVIVHLDDYWDKNYPRPNEVLTTNNLSQYEKELERWNIKPYLRPMSSMTEEEKKKLKADTCPKGTGYFDEKYLICPINHYGEYISYEFMLTILEWLNEHHFDYRGLIEKGLALEAPEGMYETGIS